MGGVLHERHLALSTLPLLGPGDSRHFGGQRGGHFRQNGGHEPRKMGVVRRVRARKRGTNPSFGGSVAHPARGRPRTGARREGLPHRPCPRRPVVDARLDALHSPLVLLGKHRGDDGVRGRKLDLGRAARDDRDAGCRAASPVVLRRGAGHSGMFPCFLAGRLARLVLRARIALMIDTRVAAGSMMPSSSPRSAARNGLATS